MKYVAIKNTFWTDVDVEEMTPEDKLFYLYLLTNPNNNQIGLFEFSVKQASFHTGYNVETIEKLLERFRKMGKIKTSRKTKELLIIKFFYHNVTKSETVKTHCKGLLNGVKDTSLIPYIYGIDTLGIVLYQEEEEEKKKKEKKEEEEKAKPLVFPYNSKAFKDIWQVWKDYRKKEHKFNYASAGSEQASLKKLGRISSSEREAIDIIEQSMANGWKGFFELKNSTNGKDKFSEEAIRARMEEW